MSAHEQPDNADQSPPPDPQEQADAEAAGEPTPDSPDMSQFEQDLGEGSQLAQVVSELDQLKEDLARARADAYNLNQEYGNYVRRAKQEAVNSRDLGRQEVVEALLGVLDDVQAARDAGDLEEGPFASIAAKLEDTLASRFGLERFGQAGEDFDPQLHEALLAATNPDVDHPVVKQVLQLGYRLGEKVLRPTKVMVDNPE